MHRLNTDHNVRRHKDLMDWTFLKNTSVNHAISLENVLLDKQFCMSNPCSDMQSLFTFPTASINCWEEKNHYVEDIYF